MATRDRYSQAVRIGRVALPLLALALMISIFLFTRDDALRDGGIFTDSEMAELAVGQKITAPNFSGVTRSGDAYSLRATEALPDGARPRKITLIDLQASVDTRRAISLELGSDQGVLDLDQSTAKLSGNVNVATSSGFRAEAQEITLDLETGNLRSLGAVQATGPLGRVSADRFEAVQNLDLYPQGGHAVLLFQSNVRLVYTPVKEDP